MKLSSSFPLGGLRGLKHEVFLFHAKLAKEQGRKDFETHCRRFFHKTKLLIIGKCFQPFELIEPIEPLELFLRQRHEDAKARSFFVSRKDFETHTRSFFIKQRR
jgi:hypothetical protein